MDLGTLTARIGVDTTGLNAAEARMRAFGVGSTSVFTKLQNAIFSVQGVLLSLGVGLSFGKIISTVTQYESAMVDMGKVTDESFESIENRLQGVDKALGNMIELTHGYYQTISAGVTDPVQALDLLETASKAAKVAHISQEETVKALTKVMAGYAGEIENATAAADLLLATEKLGQTTMGELVPIVGDLANMSHMAGASQYEMAAGLSLITQTAGSTAEAGTQWRAFMRSLLKPTEEMTAAFADFGSASNALKELGLVEFLRRFQDAAGSAEEMVKMLGGRQESFLGLSALLVDNLAKLDRNIKEITNSSGSLAAAWGRWEGSLEGIWDETKAIMVDLLISVGQKVLPGLKVALEFLNENIDGIILSLKMLAGAWVGLKLAGWVTATTVVTEGVVSMSTALVVAKGGLSAFGVALVGITGALTGVIAVGFLAWMDHLREKEQAAYDQITKHQALLTEVNPGMGRGGGSSIYKASYDETEWRNQALEGRPKAAEVTAESWLAEINKQGERLKVLSDATAKYQKELAETRMTAQQLEMVKLDEWFASQVEEIGEVLPALQDLYDAQRKLIAPTPQEGFTDALSQFVQSAELMRQNTISAIQDYGVDAQTAWDSFKEALLVRAEQTADGLVRKFDNPQMANMFVSALGEMGQKAGNALFTSLAQELSVAEDAINSMEERVQTALDAKKQKFGGGEGWEIELVKDTQFEQVYRLNNGVAFLMETVSKVGTDSEKAFAWMDDLDPKRMVNKIEASMDGLVSTGKQVGGNVGDGLYNGITDAVRKAVQDAQIELNKLKVQFNSASSGTATAQNNSSLTDKMRGDLQ